MAGGESGSTIFALANAVTVFIQWRDGSTANPRTDENVQTDLAVMASFRSTGGVDIDWYAGHGIFPGDGQTWADLDITDRFGKGMTLREELLANTNPNDPLARFVTNAPDRRYTLWRSTNLADWSPVPGQIGIPGGNGPLVDDAPPVGNAFYRVAAGLP